MAKVRNRLLLLLLTLALAALAGEGVYRLMRGRSGGPEMFFQDAGRRSYWPDRRPLPPVAEQAAFFGQFVTHVTAPMPRPGVTAWVPGSTFHICYTGPRQPYFDEQGCVEYRINALGLRDRPDLTLQKPAGSHRILCLGDSFTLGWGVRQEGNWPVLAEAELRRQWPAVQVVNCGGVGTSYADEYWYGLQHRFGALGPDTVIVTLCLNDLIITNGKLGHYRDGALADEAGGERPWWAGSVLLADLARTLGKGRELDLDPDRDYVRELLELPAGHPLYQKKAETPALYWGAGTPQQALLGIQAWCREHGARLGVVVWPLLQGLGPDQHYPFARLHQMVGEFCGQHGIPFCDLLPALRGQPPEQLWVSPADMHPNERAQQLVTPTLAAFMADVAGLR